MAWADDAALNRDLWTRINAEYTDERAAEKWAETEVAWGIWGVPDSALPNTGGGVMGVLAGLDIVDLGCGTAYMSAVFAQMGARPVGVDITPAQLETARRMMERTGIEFPLVEADAGDTGLPSGSFDIAFSEYGASIWVDPERWVPEAARLLRPGGRLIFLTSSTLSHLCTDDKETIGECLLRPQFGLERIETEDGIEFHLPHGERIRNLRRHGFQLDELIEIQAPETAERHPYYSYVSPEWGRRWPLEELWTARKIS